jgi:hypothetical protein
MIDAISRARIVGLIALIIAFGAGIAVGHYYWRTEPQAGVMISVKGTDRIPRELEELDLTEVQRTQIRQALHAGTIRVGQVVRNFMVPMDAAIDSTDREIRSFLNAEQNRRLDEIRKDHPLKQMKEKRIIDTAR